MWGPRLKRGCRRGAAGRSLSSEYGGSLRLPGWGTALCWIWRGTRFPKGLWVLDVLGGSPRSPAAGACRVPATAGAGRKPLSRWGAPSPPLRAARPGGPGPRPGPGSGCGSCSRSAWCSGPGPGARPGCAPSRHRGSALRPARTCPPGPRLRPLARAPPPAPLSAPLGARPRARALTPARSRPPAAPSSRAPLGADSPLTARVARGAPTPPSGRAGS